MTKPSGLAVGVHILAVGGTQPVPFHQGTCESQTLEPGITDNFTIDAMQAVVDYVGCNSTDLHSAETVACLRMFDVNAILDASIHTHATNIAHNIGDIWLPVVDSDFLPAPPSQLLREHRFAKVTTMIGWCQDDPNFTDFALRTTNDTFHFISSCLPDVNLENIEQLLSLSPVSDFTVNKAANLTPEFYQASRIFRDILMTCSLVGYGDHMAADAVVRIAIGSLARNGVVGMGGAIEIQASSQCDPTTDTFSSTLGIRTEQGPFSKELKAIEAALSRLPRLRYQNIVLLTRSKSVALTIRQPRQQSGQEQVYRIYKSIRKLRRGGNTINGRMASIRRGV